MAKHREQNGPSVKSKILLDLEGEGPSGLWRPYQLEIIRILFEGDPIKIANVWEKLKAKGIKISKPSVNNYLENLFFFGVVQRTENPSKGGFTRYYEMIKEPTEFENFWIMKALIALSKVFPANPYLKKVISEGLLNDR